MPCPPRAPPRRPGKVWRVRRTRLVGSSVRRMEILVHIFKQLPAFWPRAVLLGVLLLLVLLPQTRSLLTRGGLGSRRLDRAKRLLELRKIELEVAALRAQHAAAGGSQLDAQIERLLRRDVEQAGDDAGDEPTLPWVDRARLAAIGAGSFLLLTTLALGITGRRTGSELAVVAGKELLALLPCALLASAIPTRARWGPVFYGFLVPVVVAALAVTARG